MKTIYTIGHSNKPIKTFIEKLVKEGIDVLVDVRTVPYSKYNPQFNRESLRADCQEANITYAYRGKNLGGKGGKEANTNWDEAIDELYTKCDNRKIAVMCSEADPNNCHRQSTIQPDLEKKGVAVSHILWENSKVKKKDSNAVPVMNTLF